MVHDAAGRSPIIVSIGDNSIRKRIVERLSGYTFGNAIHPSAVVSDTAEIGEGTVVMPGLLWLSGRLVGAKHKWMTV